MKRTMLQGLVLGLGILGIAACGKAGAPHAGDPLPENCVRSTATRSLSGILCFQDVGGNAVVEGDIVLGTVEQMKESARTGVALAMGSDYRWPGGRVPYEVVNSVLDKSVKAAVDHVNTKAQLNGIPIQWVPKTANDRDYVSFVADSGLGACLSALGRRSGRQLIKLDSEGCDTGRIVHEMGHTLGLGHEHSREDRDKYVVVNKANMDPAWELALDRHILGFQDLGPYDFESIMHYGYDAFAKRDIYGNPIGATLTKLDGSTTGFGQLSVLSWGDAAALKMLYSANFLEAPSDLIAYARSATEIDVYYTDNSDGAAAGFRIDYATDLKGPWLEQTTSSRWSGIISRLTPSTKYYVQVRAYNGTGSSAPSARVEVTTHAPPPAAPTELKAIVQSSSHVSLYWKDNSRSETGFVVEARRGTGVFYRVGLPGIDARTYTVSGLYESTLYTFRVRARNAGGESADSNEASATTLPRVPLAPSLLTATVNSASKVTLSWKDNSYNEGGFRIERRIGTGSWTPITTEAPNVTVHVSTGLTQNTKYYFRVMAKNPGGSSPYSNECAVLIAPPAAPKVSVRPIYFQRIEIKWVDGGASGATAYRIERRVYGQPFQVIGTVKGDLFVFIDKETAPSTGYLYRVQAVNGLGSSPYSEVMTAKTY